MSNNKTGKSTKKPLDWIYLRDKAEFKSDFIPFKFGLYMFLKAQGNDGILALELYLHLLFTSQMQHGNFEIIATDEYLKTGLRVGNTRLRKAKAILSDAGIIEYIKYRNSRGQFIEDTKKPNIVLKRTYENELLTQWLEDRIYDHNLKAVGLIMPPTSRESISEPLANPNDEKENNPEDNNKSIFETYSSDRASVNTDDFKDNYPEGRNTTAWDNRPSGAGRQNNNVLINKNSIYSTDFTSIKDFIIHFEKSLQIESLPQYTLPSEVKESLKYYIKDQGYEWVLEKLQLYLNKCEIEKIRRYGRYDIPKFLRNSKKRAKRIQNENKMKHTEQSIVQCPACETELPGKWKVCPCCLLEWAERNDQIQIERVRRDWMENKGYESFTKNGIDRPSNFPSDETEETTQLPSQDHKLHK